MGEYYCFSSWRASIDLNFEFNVGEIMAKQWVSIIVFQPGAHLLFCHYFPNIELKV